MSAAQEKTKRGRRDWAAAGGSWWAGKPKGERDSLFFKLFSKQLFLSNSNQNCFKLFTKFYNPFRSYTSNQKPCKPNDDAQPLVVSILI
jgi:hypothetical protein